VGDAGHPVRHYAAADLVHTLLLAVNRVRKVIVTLRRHELIGGELGFGPRGDIGADPRFFATAHERPSAGL